jgi:pimeloyl-ACP methyl ester carboxylesterase
MADTFHQLMMRLGYTDGYVVQGGDWGSVVSLKAAIQHHEHVKGLHITFPSFFPPIKQGIVGIIDTVLSNVMPSWMFRKQRDGASVANTGIQLWKEAAYLHEQATRPDTIGAVLNQSPVALLIWYAEKLHAWSDSRDDVTADVYPGNHFPNGNLYARWSKDEIIDFVMLYWCTDTITSSIRLYWEQLSNHPVSALEQLATNNVPHTVPTAVAQFAAEPLRTPERWIKYYTNLKSYNENERGGHFAAWEEAELLANDIKQFVTNHVKIGHSHSKTAAGTAPHKETDGVTLNVEVSASDL